MDPEVRKFVILQLLVIIVPVGLLFALWLSMPVALSVLG